MNSHPSVDAGKTDEEAVKEVYPDAKIGRDHHSAYYLFTKKGAGGRISEYVGNEELAWKSARSKLPSPSAAKVESEEYQRGFNDCREKCLRIVDEHDGFLMRIEMLKPEELCANGAERTGTSVLSAEDAQIAEIASVTNTKTETIPAKTSTTEAPNELPI